MKMIKAVIFQLWDVKKKLKHEEIWVKKSKLIPGLCPVLKNEQTVLKDE